MQAAAALKAVLFTRSNRLEDDLFKFRVDLRAALGRRLGVEGFRIIHFKIQKRFDSGFLKGEFSGDRFVEDRSIGHRESPRRSVRGRCTEACP